MAVPQTQSAVNKPTRHVWRYIMWPISVWMSVRQFEKHDADDYVELTSPIMAAAVAFWICAVWLASVIITKGLVTDFQILIWMTPLIFLVGLALYINRERRFEA